MKIGILTLPFHYNYGGILQAFALQTFLQQQGHEVIFIDRPYNRKEISALSWMHRRLFLNTCCHNPQQFVKKHLRMSPILDSKAKLFDVIDSLDAVIVGSDQVWRLSMVKGMETEYFLDFATPQ